MKRAMGLFYLLVFSGLAFGQQFVVTSPKGGDGWLLGSHHDITWTFSNIPGSTSLKLLLFRNGDKVGTIAEGVPVGSNGAGVYAWHAGAYVGGTASGDGYQVRIRDMNNQYPVAMSPGSFSITRIQRMTARLAKETNPHTIHSAGTVTIRYNRYCDLDNGHEISTVPGCDFWWSQNSIAPYQRVLIPGASAKFKTLGVWSAFTYESLHSASGYSANPIVDAELPINMVVGYITDQTRCGALRVVAKGDDGSITVAWVTYDY